MFRYRLQSQDPSETLSELDHSLEISYEGKENREKKPIYFDLEEAVESQEYEKHENPQFAELQSRNSKEDLESGQIKILETKVNLVVLLKKIRLTVIQLIVMMKLQQTKNLIS